MPNPTRISLPRVNYNFDAKACVPVLTVMLNKVEKDYSTVDELCDHDELSKFTRDEIKNAVSELNGRKFLLKVDKPYGCIMGFIGQNGAGKTTTIRSLLHITDIDSGEIRLLGLDHIKYPEKSVACPCR